MNDGHTHESESERTQRKRALYGLFGSQWKDLLVATPKMPSYAFLHPAGHCEGSLAEDLEDKSGATKQTPSCKYLPEAGLNCTAGIALQGNCPPYLTRYPVHTTSACAPIITHGRDELTCKSNGPSKVTFSAKPFLQIRHASRAYSFG